MKYLFLMLFLVGCSGLPNVDLVKAMKEKCAKEGGTYSELPGEHRCTYPTKEELCKKQSVLQCMDIGDEDESERDFCQRSSYKECMRNK